MEKKIKNFWDDDKNSRIAHRAERFKLSNKKGQENINLLNKSMLNQIKFKDKILIDYGIGSGFVGHYLLKEKELKKYIGYDISVKSIKVAQEEIGEYNNQAEFMIVEGQDYTFDKWGADIFLSLACIQHFPTYEYLENFLQQLESSNIPIIALQIRYDQYTKFRVKPYENSIDAVQACHTNNNFILSILKSYRLIYNTEPSKRSKYQYLLYDRSKA